MVVRRKSDGGAVNKLVSSPLPWFQSPAGAWELGHVWLHINPFHYVLDPSKALCDLAPVSIYPSRDCTPTHMRAFTPKHLHSHMYILSSLALPHRSQGQSQTKLMLISSWRSAAFFFSSAKWRSGGFGARFSNVKWKLGRAVRLSSSFDLMPYMRPSSSIFPPHYSRAV